MSLQNLDREKLKLILRTSETFPSRFSRAKVIDDQLSPGRFGHSLGQHLRGTQPRMDQRGARVRWTSFCSLEDMAEALDLALKTPDGRSALQEIQRGNRRKLKVRISKAFDIEGEIAPDPKQKSKIAPQRFRFSRADLAKAGFSLKCFAALEGRARGSEMYLHVQTFYPYLDDAELTRLVEMKPGP